MVSEKQLKANRENAKLGGGPVTWTEERRIVIKNLFERYLKNDPLFEVDDFQEVAEVVPTLAHFISVLHEKWEIICVEYPELADVRRAPTRATILEWPETEYEREVLNLRQERGLLYGGLSGALNNSITGLMLQNHGYVSRGKQELEHSGSVGVRIIDDIDGRSTE